MKRTILVMLLVFMVPSLPAFAQDGPIPKPKPKPNASASKPAAKAPETTLLLTTDIDCDVKLDGVALGRLRANGEKVVHTSAGDHLLRAISADGQLKWQDTVTAAASTQKVIKIPLADQLPTWGELGTGLEWAKADNGSDVTWQQASDYCRNLQLAGHGDWRLATIDELQRMYDPQSNVNGYRVKGNLQLSGWEWSSSKGDASGEAWHFFFGNGRRNSDLLGTSTYERALCVRRSGE